MTTRDLFALPFAGFGRWLRIKRLQWQITACERDLMLTQRETREKLIAARHLTKELINLRAQAQSL